MTKELYKDILKRSDTIYWELLGNLSGFTKNEENGLKWLSGKGDWIYEINTSDVDYVIEQIKKNELPKNLFFAFGDISTDPLKSFIESRAFSVKTHCEFMALELNDTKINKPSNDIKIFQVTEYWQLKIVAMIQEGQEELFTFKNFEEIMTMHDTYFYLAEYKGFPASVCMAQFGDDFVNISWITTLPQFRNKGIAGYLIQAIELDAMKAGKKYATLCACDSQKAFIKVGYRKQGEIIKLEYLNK